MIRIRNNINININTYMMVMVAATPHQSTARRERIMGITTYYTITMIALHWW
jgi:hypothetical protein